MSRELLRPQFELLENRSVPALVSGRNLTINGGFGRTTPSA